MYLELTIMYFREQTIKSQTRIASICTLSSHFIYFIRCPYVPYLLLRRGVRLSSLTDLYMYNVFFFFLSRQRLLHLITCIRNSKTIDLPTTWERFPVTWYSSSPSRWRCASSASAPSSDSLDNKMRVSRNDEALSSTSHHRGWYAPYACPSGVHATCNVHFVARRVRVSDSVSSAGVMWHVK